MRGIVVLLIAALAMAALGGTALAADCDPAALTSAEQMRILRGDMTCAAAIAARAAAQERKAEELTPPPPPPLPAPGAVGGLHVVTRYLQKGVEQTGDHYSSVTLAAQGGGSEYETVVAFAWQQATPTGIALSATTACQGRDALELPGATRVDLDTSPGFLKDLLQGGRYVADTLDLSTVGVAGSGSAAWHHQPTWGELVQKSPEIAGSIPGFLRGLHVPGTMYISLKLVAEPGASGWRVAGWNFAFDVDARARELAEAIFIECPPPPPGSEPGPDAGPGELRRHGWTEQPDGSWWGPGWTMPDLEPGETDAELTE